MQIAVQGDEVRLPDGRVALADPGRDLDRRYTNGDLAPVPIERRTWNTYNYAALWIGMSHNIPSYLLASGLIAVGFNWVQAIILIALANLIVLIPMLLNSHAGTKYGIPFPVFARASFGLRGANLHGAKSSRRQNRTLFHHVSSFQNNSIIAESECIRSMTNHDYGNTLR